MTHSTLPDKKTKIVCTIGPASRAVEVLERLIAAGMNVARINFSHGDLDAHRQTIANIRAAAAKAGRRVAILGDLSGPKMRIGKLAAEPVQLQRDQAFVLQTDEIVGDEHRVSMSFPALPKVVHPGDRIFVNDGFIQLEVTGVRDREVACRVLVGGELRSHKGVNLPGIDLGISAFTDRDRQCLQFAAAEQLDAVSQSFVQDAYDIAAVRRAADELDYHPLIIAKIERARAVDNLSEILAAADGIMVARGDLGVEIPFERVAITQKRMIKQANLLGKPVIVATHMLESMIHNRRPTRAEASDVANAILDGTDCVMLSGETATGEYPEDAVAAMAAIARVTEQEREDHFLARLLQLEKIRGEIRREDLVSLTVYLDVETMKPGIVLIPSRSGATARRVSRFRLPIWVAAFSEDEAVCQRLMFSYGVFPVHTEDPSNWSHFAVDWVRQHAPEAEVVLLTREGDARRERDSTLIEIIDLRPS